jgi:hypothetical protein
MAETIDNLDISVNNAYALRMRMIELNPIKIEQSQGVQPQVQVMTNIPSPEQLALIFPTEVYPTVWAFFYAPKRYYSQRRSPFTFSRLAPSLGSAEEQEALYEEIAQTPCSTPEEEREKAVLLRCFNQIDKINSMIAYIVGRIGQFLQG